MPSSTPEATPKKFGKWIVEAKAQRLGAEAELRRATASGGTAPTRSQVQALIQECADIARGLTDADLADMADAYSKLGLRLTYHQGEEPRARDGKPRPANNGKWLVSEGRHEPLASILAGAATAALSL
ncbi:MAG TPA: hypothetical protein VF162_18545 [Streptosporangiaceae bacterium]